MDAHKMEILAPAGDKDMLRAAVFSGADCVYLGVRGFNARHGAANFDGRELAEAVAFCHARNCRVYAAVNTLVLPGREGELKEAVLQAASAGCDAVIVQDLYAAAVVKAVRPALAVHASTQMSVHSLAGVRQLAALGFSRAILARELSLEEIAAIAAASPIELEVFVHGALCVSVSGQCYASAFLGGRSANRGACAGTCRLPFMARPQTPDQLARLAEEAGRPVKIKAADTCHLSLKDLSILDALPALQALGVCSAKIEGRLRGPEYCAVAVDSARKALNKEEYDRNLLLNVFSRSGFTDGWFTGKNGGGMFGARSEADAESTRKALPKARQLYRRERPRVPVKMSLCADAAGAVLEVTDGVHMARAAVPGPLSPAAQDGEDRLRAALEKTGGTPFYLERPPALQTGGMHLPVALVNQARREALDALLAMREAPASAACQLDDATLPRAEGGQQSQQAVARAGMHRDGISLRARFEHVAQMPDNAASLCETLILPLWEADAVPEALRSRTVLWLPRVLFGPAEEKAAAAVEETRSMGFLGYEANNLGHLHLLRGLPVSGGFGLNVANSGAAAILAGLGCVTLTLSPELSLPQMRCLAEDPLLAGALATDALCYGHLPLFLTRACPLKQTTDCAHCRRAGVLYDRMGEAFPLLCRDGARSVFNPVPLWMAQDLDNMPTATTTLYFTVESRQQVSQVLEAFVHRRPAKGPFTRGLYSKGSRQQA